MGAKKARRVHQETKGRDYGKLHCYQSRAGVVLGFHGCDASLQNKLLTEAAGLGPSNNDYDWLGPGINFWENDPHKGPFVCQESKGILLPLKKLRDRIEAQPTHLMPS
jgi:hypothetical protein